MITDPVCRQSINTEMAANYAELDRLQQQCNNLRTEMSGGLLAIDQRLQASRNEYEKAMGDVDKFRRDCSDSIAHQLESIIACKSTYHSWLCLPLTARPLQTKHILSRGLTN